MKARLKPVREEVSPSNNSSGPRGGMGKAFLEEGRGSGQDWEAGLGTCLSLLCFSFPHILVSSAVYHNKRPSTGGLKNRNAFSHSSRGQKAKIKRLARQASFRGLSLGLELATISLGAHFPDLCVHKGRAHKPSVVSSFQGR